MSAGVPAPGVAAVGEPAGARSREADSTRGPGRCEIKFALPGADVGKISAILGANARRETFGRTPVSQVNSIYFDDASLSACHESISGIGRRSKVRLRWYDRPLPDDRLFFELKSRRNQVSWKERVPISAQGPLAARPYPDLLRQIGSRLSESQASHLCGRDQPVVLVSYRRQHFSDRSTGVRATLDYDIVGYDQTGCASPRRGVPSALEGLVVIEVKAASIDVDLVRQILHPLTPRRTRCSKYVLCCQRVGWLNLEASG